MAEAHNLCLLALLGVQNKSHTNWNRSEVVNTVNNNKNSVFTSYFIAMSFVPVGSFPSKAEGI
jgi:hypothetical protein